MYLSNPLMIDYEGGDLLLAGAACGRLLGHCARLCLQAGRWPKNGLATRFQWRKCALEVFCTWDALYKSTSLPFFTFLSTAVLTLNFGSDLWKVNGEIWHWQLLNICDKFHENRIFTFREITTRVRNERKNQQTNMPDHNTSYGGGNNVHVIDFKSLFTQPPMRRMRICFTDVFFCFCFLLFVFFPFATKNTRQPFSGTAERIFMKLLLNDTRENVVCIALPKWGLGPPD